ncbi:MAG: PqqD family protein [Bacteroidales bacterium]|nr:PqqD family protein [Bacteroidales bacterium]
MGKNIFQRRRMLKKANTLELTPVKNHDHQVEEDGRLALIVPKFEKKWMRRFFIAPARKDYFKIYLDDLGASTWLLIDGKKTVKQICEAMQEQKEEEIPELEDRVSKFIHMLYEQRYVLIKEMEEA